MTDMNEEFERYDLNMLASNAKESYDKLKELNRAVVKKEDTLRMAIQDRILGVIPDDELEKITREAKLANDASFDEKCRLRNTVDELNHVVFNAEYSCAEMDTSINIAMIFSDVKKMEEKEEKEEKDSSTCCETCKNYESNSDITGWCSACPGTVTRGMNKYNTCAAYEKREEN